MKKNVSSIVARQFSPFYRYLRDLTLHRLASLFVRESNRTRSSMFLLFEMYFYYLCSWERIENVPLPFFVTAKTTKIKTTTSNTELDFFIHDRWITLLLSLFSHTLFFFSFSYDKKEQCNRAPRWVTNGRAFTDDRCATSRSHRNRETSTCIRCMPLCDLTGSLFVHIRIGLEPRRFFVCFHANTTVTELNCFQSI